ncbi:MAG: prepilin-type cleavage/methylation domain-containing protein [Proteobacteria bacterium]|jgi:prepilin-type N-terminal cleavage/methylation domain-containing protein|nr:prepilin-type cleavage/methylation domain-containing protein [Pseudomonadota bacterium]MDP6246809.1 prepilin-type N-terminal cleavage/methylation domain-containing protein [SAR324 cluster bacterium]
MKAKSAFSVLEVLIALSILSITLMAVYQSFASSLFVLQSTKTLWKAMAETQKNLLYWEHSKEPPSIQVQQGTYDDGDSLPGANWKMEVKDMIPLPGIRVRRVNYEITWMEGEREYRYSSDLYVKAE